MAPPKESDDLLASALMTLAGRSKVGKPPHPLKYYLGLGLPGSVETLSVEEIQQHARRIAIERKTADDISGVGWHVRDEKWQVQPSYKGRRLGMGNFCDAELALAIERSLLSDKSIAEGKNPRPDEWCKLGTYKQLEAARASFSTKNVQDIFNRTEAPHPPSYYKELGLPGSVETLSVKEIGKHAMRIATQKTSAESLVGVGQNGDKWYVRPTFEGRQLAIGVFAEKDFGLAIERVLLAEKAIAHGISPRPKEWVSLGTMKQLQAARASFNGLSNGGKKGKSKSAPETAPPAVAAEAPAGETVAPADAPKPLPRKRHTPAKKRKRKQVAAGGKKERAAEKEQATAASVGALLELTEQQAQSPTEGSGRAKRARGNGREGAVV